jgi:tetratricopeptide (TPR) repeat protein/tRNA A-37 threonylcarbamoyl transferase component Bud32
MVVGVKCPKCHFENTGTSRYCADCGTSLTPVHGFPLPSSPPTETQTLPPFFELETGTLFAERYQVIEKLGMGGMGRVYKVYDTKIREKIALKLLKPEITFEEKTVERFRSEIRLARRIAHKNVCRMFDWGEFSRLFYITMEYVPGENLKNIIRMSGPLHVSKAVNYGKQICEGLAEAHRWDVVHRDLKPHNVMIDPTGAVRIMDFGIARSVHAKGWTGEGIAVGTPEYMSPEQAEGQDVDKRTDIYSLGIILYEMITGKVPFEGETTLSILRKQELEPPIPPKEWNPQIPESFDRLILKCLEKKKDRRYQSAEEVLQDLSTISTEVFPTPKVGRRTASKLSIAGKRPRYLTQLGAGFILIILAVSGYLLLKPGRRAMPEVIPDAGVKGKTQKVQLAVFPFDVVGPDSEQYSSSTDIAGDIRRRMVNMEGLAVQAPYSSEWLKKSDNRLEEIRKLGLDYILEGTVSIDKARITVKPSLSDAHGGVVLWTNPYTENLEGGFSRVTDKISDEVARQLKLSFPEGRLPFEGETDNTDAYINMHKGQELEREYRESGRIEDFEEAVRLYNKAIDLDPNYALAYVNLGNVWEGRFVETKKPEDLATMVGYFRKAYEKDSSMAEVQVGWGWASFHQGEFDKAFACFQRALKIDPDGAEVNYSAGSFLRSIGLDALALKHYERAIGPDPYNDSNYELGALCAWNLGDYQTAERLIKKALNITPESPRIHLQYARFLTSMKNFEAAAMEITRAETIQPPILEIQMLIRQRRALILAARGEKEKALSLVQGVTEPYRYEITNIYSLVGMKDEAIRYIRKGNEEGFQLIKDYLYPYPMLMSNPFFENLRSDPRFKELVRKEKDKFDLKMKKYGSF